MALGGKKKPAPPPPTQKELIATYERFAMAELDRANKAGRLEAQTVHALRSVAASNLALLKFTIIESNNAKGAPSVAVSPDRSAEIDAQLAALDAQSDDLDQRLEAGPPGPLDQTLGTIPGLPPPG